jgi:hypothetical protein
MRRRWSSTRLGSPSICISEPGGRGGTMNERSFAFGVSAVAALCSVSCGAGLLSDMGRSLEDPRLAAPSVASFADEHRIDVSWAADADADLCVLERAPDAAVPSWETIYRGTGTRYADTKCSDQGRYLYRLTELRGERSFGPSEAVPGVAGATCRDALEPDDEEPEATPLERPSDHRPGSRLVRGDRPAEQDRQSRRDAAEPGSGRWLDEHLDVSLPARDEPAADSQQSGDSHHELFQRRGDLPL